MFERIEYTVERIDGDYAYLKNEASPDEELKLWPGHSCRKRYQKEQSWLMRCFNIA